MMSIEELIANIFPDYSRNSLLDRALERIKASAFPEQDLEILRRFSSTLPEEDFLIFSGVDVSVDQRIRIATDGVEYWEELGDIYPLFDDESTQMVCLRANGDVWWQNLAKEFIQIESLFFPRKSFDILVRAFPIQDVVEWLLTLF